MKSSNSGTFQQLDVTNVGSAGGGGAVVQYADHSDQPQATKTTP